MPFAPVHGPRIFYREKGAAPSELPVVFVHGAGSSSALWQPVLVRLCRHRRVLALDLPGHGRSEGGVRSIEEMRDALGSFAAAMSLGRAVLVGHSMGGMVALAATLAWPERVAGLGLICTAARLGVSALLLESIRVAWSRWPELVAKTAYASQPFGLRSSPIACMASQEQTLSDFEACTRVDYRSRLGEIDVPTVVVSGDADRLTPPQLGEELAAGIRGALRVSLPRCGHMPMQEQPDGLCEALLALLQRR